MSASIAFSGSLIITSVVVASGGLLYLFIGLAQVAAALEALFPSSPDHPPSTVQHFVLSLIHELLGGAAPVHLNQSAFAAAAVLCALVVLLTFVEEALLRVKEKVQAWGKLPTPQVLHHYNGNSYETALAQVGRGLSLSKPM
ncbi:hypothetical protein NESM_000145000 [Novymonas esmeraldas]|uniref:Uncharacterized protein n=1 Tax=Novymonas esmeraldas TaxID=1808958 RepID=A0AAW0F6M4_9TRYP